MPNSNGAMRSSPMMSVIIVTKDNEQDLVETIKSIQGLSDSEIIIVSGSDVPISASFMRENFDESYIVLQGPDSGIYNGMNRGLERATGKYIWFLNSGDTCISPNQVEMIPLLLSALGRHWAVGMQDPPLRFPVLGLSFQRIMLFAGIRPIPHQSTIMERWLCIELNGFDEHYRIEADQEFFIRAYLKGFVPLAVREPLSRRKVGGVGDQQKVGIFAAQVKIILKHLDYRAPDNQAMLIFAIRICYALLTRVRKTIHRSGVIDDH